ncbi:hypothetical protein ACFLU6_03160, partial [Acidobacteriota bacterium]
MESNQDLSSVKDQGKRTPAMRILLVLPVLLGVAFALHPLFSTDIWWHLAEGRTIVEQLKIPIKDTLSYTAAHRDEIHLYSGFQFIVYAVYKLAGVHGLIALKILLVILFMVLLVRICSRAGNELVAAAWLVFAVLIWK